MGEDTVKAAVITGQWNLECISFCFYILCYLCYLKFLVCACIIDSFGGAGRAMKVEATAGSNVGQDSLAETAKGGLDLQKKGMSKRACQVEGHE